MRHRAGSNRDHHVRFSHACGQGWMERWNHTTSRPLHTCTCNPHMLRHQQLRACNHVTQSPSFQPFRVSCFLAVTRSESSFSQQTSLVWYTFIDLNQAFFLDHQTPCAILSRLWCYFCGLSFNPTSVPRRSFSSIVSSLQVDMDVSIRQISCVCVFFLECCGVLCAKFFPVDGTGDGNLGSR